MSSSDFELAFYLLFGFIVAGLILFISSLG